MMLATFIFMGAALALATYLILTSLRTSRAEERQLLLAREREHTALLVAERARAQRAEWEARIAEEQLLSAASDPRTPSDGVDRSEAPRAPRAHTGRFRRDVPAPFTSAR